tara:strand:- start:824 stop:1255 length:432 start_codon:yes stop_codon:yes gene_type:complete
VGIGLQEDANATPAEKPMSIEDVYLWGSEFPPPSGAEKFLGEEAEGSPVGKIRGILEGYSDDFVTTEPVGSFGADTNGLYDLSGNVWELAADWRDDAKEKVSMRGGAWNRNKPVDFLSSYRYSSVPDSAGTGIIGLRVVFAED